MQVHVATYQFSPSGIEEAYTVLASATAHGILATTLTKRMSEYLTDYLYEHGIKTRYLHSDVDTVERV